MKDIKKPKVSIWSITCNHASFIEDCLESIIGQKTNFKFELIIGDDASTDGTSEILNTYANRYPDIVKPIFHKKNVGMHENSLGSVYPRLIGEYIAICEGDDYWTDPNKLQRQVDFLDDNSDVGGVATNSIIKYDDRPDGLFGIRKSRKVKFEEIVLGRQFHTATFMYRNNIIIPKGLSGLLAVDTPLFLLVAQKSSIYYMDYISAVYRRGSHGVTSTHDDLETEELKKYNDFLNQIAQEAGISLVDKEKVSWLLPRIIHYFGSKAEGLYFKIYPNAQRHIFDISIFNPLRRVCYRLGLLKK